MRRFFAILIASCIHVSPSVADTVVGRSVVDGKPVEILADRTWRFVDETVKVDGCREIQLGIRFCGDSAVWERTLSPSADIAAQFRYDDRNYGQFVVEAVGSSDGMNLEVLRKAIIGNAANVAGLQPQDIVIIDVLESTMAGQSASTIVFGLPVDGLKVVFADTIVLLPNRTIQAMTFSVGSVTTYTNTHKALHAEFLSLTQVDDQ